MNHVVLWSGGPHSTYTIYYLASRGLQVTALHVRELGGEKNQLPPLKESANIEPVVAEILAPLTWTKLITMGFSAAHWIETRTTSIITDIPEEDKIAAIHLGKEIDSEEVRKLTEAINPEYSVKQFYHILDVEEMVEMMASLEFFLAVDAPADTAVEPIWRTNGLDGDVVGRT